MSCFYPGVFCGWAIRTPVGKLQFSFKGFHPESFTPEERAQRFAAWVLNLLYRHGPVNKILVVQPATRPDPTWELDTQLGHLLKSLSGIVGMSIETMPQGKIEQRYGLSHPKRYKRIRQLQGALWAEHHINAKNDAAAVAIAALLVAEESAG
jgi:hypothetical protein